MNAVRPNGADYLMLSTLLFFTILLWMFLKINWSDFSFLRAASIPVSILLFLLALAQASLILKCYAAPCRRTFDVRLSTFDVVKNLGFVGVFMASSLLLTGVVLAVVAWVIFRFPEVRADAILKRDIYAGLEFNASAMFWWLLGVSFLIASVLRERDSSKCQGLSPYVGLAVAGLSFLSFFAHFRLIVQ